MSQDLPVRLTAESAGELARRAELSDGARLLVRPDQGPRELLDRLVDGRHHLDAVRLMAHALPKREALWWAARCARMAAGDPPEGPVAAALEAADAWFLDPVDANRRAAMTAAEAAGLGTPAGCACAGIYFSGGSVAPVGVPDVPPADHATAQFVAAAVALAAVRIEPEKAPDKHRLHLALGRRIIDGEERPPSPPGDVAPSQSAGPLAAAEAAEPGPAPAQRPSLFF